MKNRGDKKHRSRERGPDRITVLMAELHEARRLCTNATQAVSALESKVMQLLESRQPSKSFSSGDSMTGLDAFIVKDAFRDSIEQKINSERDKAHGT